MVLQIYPLARSSVTSCKAVHYHLYTLYTSLYGSTWTKHAEVFACSSFSNPVSWNAILHIITSHRKQFSSSPSPRAPSRRTSNWQSPPIRQKPWSYHSLMEALAWNSACCWRSVLSSWHTASRSGIASAISLARCQRGCGRGWMLRHTLSGRMNLGLKKVCNQYGEFCRLFYLRLQSLTEQVPWLGSVRTSWLPVIPVSFAGSGVWEASTEGALSTMPWDSIRVGVMWFLWGTMPHILELKAKIAMGVSQLLEAVGTY